MTTEQHLLQRRTDLLSARYPVLKPVLDAFPDAPPGDRRRLSELMLDVLEHDHLVEDAERGELWAALVDAAGSPAHRDDLVRNAIVLNMLGIVALARPRDFRALVSLVDLAGHETVANVHDQIDQMARTTAGLRWTTELIRRLQAPTTGPGRQVDAAEGSVLTPEELDVCAQAAVELLLRGVEAAGDQTVDPILTSAGFWHLTEHGDAHRWRLHLASVAADPWGEHASCLVTFARAAERPGIATTIERCTRRFRTAAEDAERRAIAEHIGALVRISGLPQQTFAARVGTSPSRMSTYVRGQVTPSATMVLRMKRVASRLAPEHADDEERLTDG